MPFLLSGPAYKSYLRLPLDEKQNYPSICKMLSLHFGKVPLPLVFAYKRLIQTKMIDGERVQEFYEKVLSHSEGLKVSDEIIMGCLLNGLPDYIQSYVNLRQPTDLSDAHLLAKQGELVARYEAKNGNFICRNVFKDTLGKRKSSRDHPQNFSQCASMQPCRFCQQIGHKESTCRIAKRQLCGQRQYKQQKINRQPPRSNKTGLTIYTKIQNIPSHPTWPHRHRRFPSILVY